MWVPPEDVDPVVLHAPTRKSMAVFGAMRVSDGRLTSFTIDSFNGDTFQVFLRQLLRHKRKGRRIVVVVDNASWHRARALQPWLREHRKSLRLDFLPPYSPDLNPIERVWKLIRRLCTHNRYFATLDELVQVVGDQLCEWGKPNQTLRRLCAIS
jgi:transposase